MRKRQTEDEADSEGAKFASSATGLQELVSAFLPALMRGPQPVEAQQAINAVLHFQPLASASQFLVHCASFLT